LSYVIQNFYNRSRHVILTPRFRFLYILCNLEKFFVFFKFNTILYLMFKLSVYQIDYFFFFIKAFFSRLYIKLLYKTNLELIGNYTNNLTKSSIYWTFANINRFFKFRQSFLSPLLPLDEYLYNYYFFSIKTVNVRINNQLYKNIFFFFMIFFPSLWLQHASYLRYYLNFILITYHFQISRFYNGHFLRIYNF
jgi:hypothetical protein